MPCTTILGVGFNCASEGNLGSLRNVPRRPSFPNKLMTFGVRKGVYKGRAPISSECTTANELDLKLQLVAHVTEILSLGSVVSDVLLTERLYIIL